jgi:hypothetical protein
MVQIEKVDNKIQDLVKKQQAHLHENSYAVKEGYPQKIRTLSKALIANCVDCEEIKSFQHMLFELAKDLTKNENPSAPVRRSIDTRFKVIIKHLQGKHGLSLPQQFRDAGIALGSGIFGMTGLVVMVFTMNILYPLSGLIGGGIAGYFWGKKRDAKAQKEGTMLHFL